MNHKKRLKQKYPWFVTQYRKALDRELSLGSWFELRRSIVELKETRRHENRFGSHLDWANMEEFLDDSVSVPIVSNRDNSLLLHRIIFDRSDIPEEFHDVYDALQSLDNSSD